MVGARDREVKAEKTELPPLAIYKTVCTVRQNLLYYRTLFEAKSLSTRSMLRLRIFSFLGAVFITVLGFVLWAAPQSVQAIATCYESVAQCQASHCPSHCEGPLDENGTWPSNWICGGPGNPTPIFCYYPSPAPAPAVTGPSNGVTYFTRTSPSSVYLCDSGYRAGGTCSSSQDCRPQCSELVLGRCVGGGSAGDLCTPPPPNGFDLCGKNNSGGVCDAYPPNSYSCNTQPRTDCTSNADCGSQAPLCLQQSNVTNPVNVTFTWPNNDEDYVLQVWRPSGQFGIIREISATTGSEISVSVSIPFAGQYAWILQTSYPSGGYTRWS